MTGWRRRTAVVVAAAAGLLAATVPAAAGINGKAVHAAMSVSSASWGAAGAATGGTPTIGAPFTLHWTLNLLGVNPQFFTVVNTGVLDLSAETYTTTISGGPKITLIACVGADWSTVLGLLGSCAGTQVGLGDSSSGPTTANVAIPTGSAVSVRAAVTGLLALGSYTTSVTVTVKRSQARAATTLNS